MNAASSEQFPIAIIGAGFAGIGMGIQLKKAGIHSFTIFERADEVGGTWRDNTYPGCACDVPSDVYSFSFELNPDWSRTFSQWDEIQDYLLACTDKHGLRDYLRLGVGIEDASFDEDRGIWVLRTSEGETFEARAVISGVGGLVDPSVPAIEGLENYTGDSFHTARWNHDVDLTGKRVGVIGTGASAVQVIPEVAKVAKNVTVFQRTPGWVLPKMERRVKARTKQLYRRAPLVQRAVRTAKYWFSELMGPLIFLDAPRLSGAVERLAGLYLDRTVKDPVTREKLRPDFQFGCKRILLTDEYYPAFNRDNVELVTSPIREVRSGSIQTQDDEHDIDVLVLATGFKLGLAAAPFPIRGLGGRSLDDSWASGATAYKGISVAGFPNWFIMMGPNTGPGHTSVLVYTEAQIRHAIQAIQKMMAEDLKYVTVKQHVQDSYNEGIQARMKHMVWTSGSCNSWYLNADGSNHSLYPGYAAEYVMRVRNFEASDYEIVAQRRTHAARGEGEQHAHGLGRPTSTGLN